MQFEIKDKAMTELSVSILSADLANLAAETADSMVCGADMVHFDVMDGHFVPNITYGAPVLKCLKKAVPEAFYDVHLMISDPARYAQDFAAAGANLINFHIEAVPNHVGQTIAAVRETGCLVGKPEQELIKDYTGFATHASEQSSRQEVSAVRIERDVEDLYKAEYMHNHLGEVYTGTVAGVTPRGIFVALENTVEGFVPAAQLCKGEATVVEGVSILDPLTGKRWMLGDPVKVQVAGANVALGRIDFDYMPL